MSIIYGIVKNIVAYMIFMTVVMNLLGKSSYKKYAGLFTGMLFILVVLQPLLQLLQIDNVLDYFFEANSYRVEADDMSSALLNQEEAQKGQILKDYKEKIALQITEVLNNHDLYPSEIHINIIEDTESNRFGEIGSLDITASYTRTDITEYNSNEGVKQVEKVVIDPITIQDEQNEPEENSDALKAIEEYEALKNGDRGENVNNMEIIRIKTLLGDFYNMKTSNINIMIQE